MNIVMLIVKDLGLSVLGLRKIYNVVNALMKKIKNQSYFSVSS